MLQLHSIFPQTQTAGLFFRGTKALPQPIPRAWVVSAWFFAASVFLFPVATLEAQDESRPVRPFAAPVIALAGSPDGKLIFAAAGGEVSILDTKLEPKGSIKTGMDFVYDLLVVDDRLLVAGGDPAEQGRLEVYQIKGHRLELQQRKVFHEDVIHRIDWADGQLVTAGADAKILVLDGKTLQPKLAFAQHSKRVQAVQFLPRTGQVLSGGLDDTLRVWSPKDGKIERVMNHHQDDVLDLAVDRIQAAADPGPPRAVSVSRDRTVRFWQPTIGRLVRFRKFEALPTVCRWVARDAVLVGFADGTIIRLSAQTLDFQTVLDTDSHVHSLLVLDDVLVVGSDRGVYLGQTSSH